MDKLKPCQIANISKMVEKVEIQLNNHAEEWHDALKRAQVDGTYDKNSGLWKYKDQSRVDRASYVMEAYQNATTIVADLGQEIDNMSRPSPKNKPMTEELLCEENENFIQNKFGYCFYSLGYYPLIYNLYVHPQYRNCGNSKALLELVIREIRKSGYEGEIRIQAKPRENSIGMADLTKYYKGLGLAIYDARKPDVTVIPLKTNFDRIIQSPESLAKFIDGSADAKCCYCIDSGRICCDPGDCQSKIVEWLMAESEGK